MRTVPSVRTTMRGAAFFDRDGTLVADSGYTHRVSDLRWLPQAVDAIKLCNNHDLLVIVVTNQSGIARGFFDEAAMHAFHERMQTELSASSARIDAFYHCPFHPDASRAEFAHPNHPDRKPNPGMINKAILDFSLDAKRSFLVGDAPSDVLAAEAAGIAGYQVAKPSPSDPSGLSPGPSPDPSDPSALSLLQVTESAIAALRVRPTSVADLERELGACAADAKAWLFEKALPLWAEAGFSSHSGCFVEKLPIAPGVAPYHRVRVQARQTAVYAMAGSLGWPGPWRESVERGARILLDRALRTDGGTNHRLGARGEVIDARRDLYDAAFVVFAFSLASTAVKDARLSQAGEDLAAWIEENWALGGGAYEEGELVATPPRRQNPHMHFLEALISLFEATNKTIYLERAEAIAHHLRSTMMAEVSSALPEYFTSDWKALATENAIVVEPGHEFEWCWLLLRLARLTGRSEPDLPRTLWRHAECYGVDRGGVTLNAVTIDGAPLDRSSRLWPNAERLKANLAMWASTRDPLCAKNAIEAYRAMMSYCDREPPGLWWDVRTPSGDFVTEPAPASSFYHIVLALRELIATVEPDG